jgi:hypothetical protein
MSRSNDPRVRGWLAGFALLASACALFAVYAAGQWQYTVWFVRACFP